jgi:hypothetical protein
VLIVKVVEAAAPVGVTMLGEKLQDAPVGRPEQEKLTAWLNPFDVVTAMVAVPDWPTVTLSAAGDAVKEKSGATAVPDKATVCGLPLALSAMETEAVRVPVAVGLKVTLIAQLALAASVAAQVLVSL